MSEPIRIIIVDDHPLIKEGIKQILSFYEDLTIVGEGSDGEEALSLIATLPCDILLLDINMPKLNGIEVLKRLRQSHPEVKILLLTVENDFHTFKEAIDYKVNGYILKESAGSTLIHAIRQIYLGEHFIDQPLTKHIFQVIEKVPSLTESTDTADSKSLESLSPREKEILFYISNGLTSKQIGSKLFLSEKTIRNCTTKIFKKINVSDRVQATIFALKNNLEL